MNSSGLNLTAKGETRTQVKKTNNQMSAQLILIKHPAQTDSTPNATATLEMDVIENEQNKIQQTLALKKRMFPH